MPLGEKPLDSLAGPAFDAMPAEAVVVDPAGIIRHVNRAWRDFAHANGGAADLYIGHNYFTMLSHVRPPLDQLAATIAQGLRAVLTGRAEEFISPDHRCHRPGFVGRSRGGASAIGNEVAVSKMPGREVAGCEVGGREDEEDELSTAEQRWFRLLIRPLMHRNADGKMLRWALLVYENVTATHLPRHWPQPGFGHEGGEPVRRDQNAALLEARRAEADPVRQSPDLLRAGGHPQPKHWSVNNAVFLQAVLDDIADMVITTDEMGNIQSFNRAAEAAFGFSASSVLGGNVSLLMADADAAQHDQHMERYRNTGVPHILGLTRQVKARRSDGEIFWVELRTTECWFDGHRLFVSTMRDMSERRQMEADLRQAKQLAEASNRAKSDFLARMSHELRTPLNSILGFAEVIKGQLFGNDPDRYADYAQHIYDSGSWLLGLINDILDLSKIEAGRLELHIARLAPMPLVTAAVDIVSAQLARKGLTLALDLPKELPAIDIDARAFQQILINLLSNAIKFTPDGGAIRISSSVQPAVIGAENDFAGNELRLMISDTGIGISSEKIGRVMEPFGHSENGLIAEMDAYVGHLAAGGKPGAAATADEPAPIQKGSGLGLSICKRLMELQRGQLSLTSELGRGTTVTMSFPLLD